MTRPEVSDLFWWSFSLFINSILLLFSRILRPDFEQPEQPDNRLTISRNIIKKIGVTLFF
jgi:hypothetical protein